MWPGAEEHEQIRIRDEPHRVEHGEDAERQQSHAFARRRMRDTRTDAMPTMSRIAPTIRSSRLFVQLSDGDARQRMRRRPPPGSPPMNGGVAPGKRKESARRCRAATLQRAAGGVRRNAARRTCRRVADRRRRRSAVRTRETRAGRRREHWREAGTRCADLRAAAGPRQASRPRGAERDAASGRCGHLIIAPCSTTSGSA